MSQTRVFLLPDLGEGLTEAELVSWHVSVGDTITVDQPIAEVREEEYFRFAHGQSSHWRASTASRLRSTPGR